VSSVTSRWQLSVDSDRCIGSGICVATAPDRFHLIEGLSQPVDGQTGADDAILDAALSCPTEAIAVRDLETGELLAPEED
jgi:ferredoxin